jgi:Holliday junction DNA helicase RuvA
MIASLSGILESVAENACVVDVGGVGYLVFCSGRTLADLPAPGQPVRFTIETHVREDHIHLFGFIEAVEKEWFNLLISVQGVGARVALGVLSVLTGDDLAQAIFAQDKAAISRAPHIGPKLAGRICSELKDKAGKLAMAPTTVMAAGQQVDQFSGQPAGGSVADAISALVNLGYRRADAFGAVQEVLAANDGDADLDVLIRDSLKALSA